MPPAHRVFSEAVFNDFVTYFFSAVCCLLNCSVISLSFDIWWIRSGSCRRSRTLLVKVATTDYNWAIFFVLIGTCRPQCKLAGFRFWVKLASGTWALLGTGFWSGACWMRVQFQLCRATLAFPLIKQAQNLEFR